LNSNGFNTEELTQKAWGDLFEVMYTETKADTIKRGRPKKNNQLCRIIFSLWAYLQIHTKYKASCTYTNEQTNFIFKFLKIFNMFPNSEHISNGADLMAYYLKSYISDLESCIKEISKDHKAN